MNFNISPIAFYPSRAAQAWRAWYYQCKVCVVVGDNLPAFVINDAPMTAPDTVEIYNASDDTLAATRTGITDILAHTSTIDGQSVNSWIYQGTSNGIFGFTQAGYYYLKIGSYYSDVIKFGEIVGDYVKLNWQFFDDIITADGTLISKYVLYQQIFETDLWHPAYNVTEEGKENNGIFYAIQQTTKKNCGFTALVNEAQVDCLNLARMADSVQIEARVNGVVKTFNSNTFEIKSDWQSDDVASIECQFDLFNIIRKYQISNERPKPLPVPVPPPPPSNYTIKGKSTASTLKLKINGSVVTIPVYNGEFEYGYDSPITSIATFNNADNLYRSADLLQGVSNITELDLSESDGLQNATMAIFAGMTNCVKANFTNCTFGAAENCGYFIAYAEKLTDLRLPDATFASTKWSFDMFFRCKSIKTISLPKATIVKLTDTIGGIMPMPETGLFEGCEQLENISVPLSTFADYTRTNHMFADCKKLKTINMPLATFASVTKMQYMFANADGLNDGLQDIADFGALFPSCTAKPTSLTGMFSGSGFEVIDLTDLDMSLCTEAEFMFAESLFVNLIMNAAQFSTLTDIKSMFEKCTNIGYSTIELLASVTFANATNVSSMFKNADVRYPSKAVSLDDCTFASATNVSSMFEGCGFVNIILPSATFANVTNANKMLYNCKAATYITLTSATFASVSSADSFALGCNALTNFTVPNSETWPKSFSLAQSASLSFESFEKIVDWVKDVRGDTAQTFTANATAKSNWQTSEPVRYLQAVTLLNGKNWNIQ